MEILQPPGWPRPKGYSNGLVAGGRMVFVAGQVGWNEREQFETDDIVRMTWFIADKKEYLGSLKEIGAAYKEIIGRFYPPMSVIEVSGFIEDGAKLEVETTAMIPEG